MLSRYWDGDERKHYYYDADTMETAWVLPDGAIFEDGDEESKREALACECCARHSSQPAFASCDSRDGGTAAAFRPPLSSVMATHPRPPPAHLPSFSQSTLGGQDLLEPMRVAARSLEAEVAADHRRDKVGQVRDVLGDRFSESLVAAMMDELDQSVDRVIQALLDGNIPIKLAGMNRSAAQNVDAASSNQPDRRLEQPPHAASTTNEIPLLWNATGRTGGLSASGERAPGATPLAGLSSGWEMKVDAAGAPFYINHSTQQTQWEHRGTGNTHRSQHQPLPQQLADAPPRHTGIAPAAAPPPGCATGRPAHTNRSKLKELSEGMDEAERDAKEALECENSGRAVDLYLGAAVKLRSLVDAFGAEMGAALRLELHARAARYVASADTVC
jgi:hypothetical protein